MDVVNGPRKVGPVSEARLDASRLWAKVLSTLAEDRVSIQHRSFLKNAKVTLQKVDKATESLEDTGPLSVIGTAVGTLF